MTSHFKSAAYICAVALVLICPASAQDKPKVLAESGKATVSEATLAAGAVATINAQTGPFLTRYYLSSGTLEYTYADGSKQNVTRTMGTAVIIAATDKRPVTVKNVGKTALHYISVAVK
jgi:hypothetical protein